MMTEAKREVSEVRRDRSGRFSDKSEKNIVSIRREGSEGNSISKGVKIELKDVKKNEISGWTVNNWA